MKNLYYFSRNAVILITAILLTGLIVVSCKKAEDNQPAKTTKAYMNCPDYVTPLWAGQNILAGNLVIWNDDVNLHVIYQITSTDPNLAMEEVHLWAGKDINECPENNNSLPKIGKFTYFADATSSKPDGGPAFLTDPLNYEFTIPLADIDVDLTFDCGTQICVAAHAQAVGETIWGQGTRFVPEPGDWAMYTTYVICCDFSNK